MLNIISFCLIILYLYVMYIESNKTSNKSLKELCIINDKNSNATYSEIKSYFSDFYPFKNNLLMAIQSYCKFHLNEVQLKKEIQSKKEV